MIDLVCETEKQEQIRDELIQCIDIVNNFLYQARQAGVALSQIQEGKLYRYWYKTFNEFTKTVWNMSAENARHLMKFSRVCKILEDKSKPELVKLLTVTNTQPLSKKISEDKVVDIIVKASDNGTKVKVTKQDIKQAANLEIKSKKINKKINDFILEFDEEKLDELMYQVDRWVGAAQAYMDNIDRFNSNQEVYKEVIDRIHKGGKALEKALKYMKLDKNSSREQLKSMRKQMAMKAHPDKGGTEEEMVKINEYFTIIKDFIDERTNSKIKQ